MPLLRSLIFNASLYVSMIIWMVGALPLFIFRRAVITKVIRAWGRYFIWLCRVVGGMSVEIRGLERVPAGPLLVAAKHQSVYETFALLSLFDDPCFILKRELTYIPLFGWYAIKARQVPLDRRGGSVVLRDLNARARFEVRHGHGRQLIMFPEGTRRPPGAEPAYRQGVSHVYEQIGVPCLPVALNTGLYWPRRSMVHRPGTIIIEILDVIPTGLPREVFMATLKERIETASESLLQEGIAALGGSVMPIGQTTRPTERALH